MTEIDRETVSFAEAAILLGTDRKTVSGLAKAKGLRCRRVPRNGKAKGLSPRHIEILREALAPVSETADAS